MKISPFEVLVQLAETGTPPADDEAVARFSAGLETTVDRFDQETLPFLTAGGSELQFLYGPYGRGKTHLLRVLGHSARRRGFVTAPVDCADGESPFKSLISTYRWIAARMTPATTTARSIATWREVGVPGVIEACLQDREMSQHTDVVERLRADRSLAPDFRNVAIAYSTCSANREPDESLMGQLAAMLVADPTYRVTVGPLYRNHPELPRPLGTLAPRNAASWLRSLLSLPRVLGYPGLVVFFDETETALHRGSPRQQQTHLAHIRTFVDHLATGAYKGCAVYYAVAEEFMDIAQTNLNALAQRIQRVTVGDFDTVPPANPRAIWVDIDELTVPSTSHPRFFEELADRILALGDEAGIRESNLASVRTDASSLANRYAHDLNDGRVREFVKDVAELTLGVA